MASPTAAGMPFETQPQMLRSPSPWTKALRSLAIWAFFFLEMARRTMSAWPREKPPSLRKISITCSW